MGTRRTRKSIELERTRNWRTRRRRHGGAIRGRREQWMKRESQKRLKGRRSHG